MDAVVKEKSASIQTNKAQDQVDFFRLRQGRFDPRQGGENVSDFLWHLWSHIKSDTLGRKMFKKFCILI
jgi:hypothetical protein